MKVFYRGFEIWARRERAMGGWMSVYYCVVRECDGLILVDSFTTGSDPVREIVKGMKGRVDEAIRTRGRSECIKPALWRVRRV